MSTSTCDANLRNPGATAKKCLRLRHLTPFSYISWIFFRDLFVAALSFLLSLAARSLNIFHIFRSWWWSMTVKILSPWPFSISIYVKLCLNTYINELCVDELINTIVRLLETSKTLMWGQLILEAKVAQCRRAASTSSCTQNLGWEACASCNNGYTDYYIACRDISWYKKNVTICLYTQQIDANGLN